MLDHRLRTLPPFWGRVVEIGNGRRRRGGPTGAQWTVDLHTTRRPHVQADALRLPFSDGSLQAVVCCETLQYIKDWECALHEIRRVLMRGGRFIASWPWRLAPLSDEAVSLRWSERGVWAALARADFTPIRVLPLWPPCYSYTSGWLAEGRAGLDAVPR